MDVAAEIMNSLLPLALLVALGAGLRKSGFVAEPTRVGLDRLVYWLALPSLIVAALAPDESGEVVATGAERMMMALMGATLLTAVAAIIVVKLLRRPRSEAGVFGQAAFRGNLAFVGLPVISLVTAGDEAVLARAALLFAPVVLLYNIMAVIGLVAAQHRLDKSLPLKMLKSMATNPLLIACVLGLVLWYFRLDLPKFLDTTLSLIGRTASPLALLSLGGALVTHPVGRHVGSATAAALLKCAVCPAFAWALAWGLDLGSVDRQTVMIFAACPTAVASYVLATQLRGDAALASAAIVISTLLSGVSLGVVLAIT